MEAINILNPNNIKQAFKYEDCYVIETEQKVRYQVLSRIDITKDMIPRGYEYRHYQIEGVIYESTWTSDYKAIIPRSKGYEQLSMF